jgi:hypothetical protein
MDNMKFIARYAALAAIIAGVSSQASAQELCPITTQCPPPTHGGTTTQHKTIIFEDTTGLSQLPFVLPGNPNLVLSVPKFDAAAAAASEGIPGLTAADITLVGVELQLEMTASEVHVQAAINDVGIQQAIPVTWTYALQADILANAALGTPNVSVQFAPIVQNVNLQPLPATYDWFLTGPVGPNGGGGAITRTECFAQTASLTNWVKSGGDTTASFEITSGANYSFDDGQCTCQDNGVDDQGIATVKVRYTYCFEGEEIITPFCGCVTPSPNYRNPGSLLLFPEFDNRDGDISILTITNTDCTGAAGGSDVDVEFVYIDKDDCGENNKKVTLTPCDTLTLLTNIHNPNHDQGYVYAFAKDVDGNPIVWNHLIGSLLIVSGLESFDYGINPVVFKGIGSASGVIQSDGRPTDIDGDGNRDLDGKEYEPAPNTITIPRFLGQDLPGAGSIRSQMILIALTGGVQFETGICLEVFNDNEEQFSRTYSFTCWEKPYLMDIDAAFGNQFLKTTNHDPLEIIGAPMRESGWICIQGCIATSGVEDIEDPAIYAVLVERVGSWGVADLPFECGNRFNGSLLPNSQFGDGDPTPVAGDNQ